MENTLQIGEIHPASHIAKRFLMSKGLKLLKYHEALASCALSGNRLAEICCETLRRLQAKEPVSDRYLMGLAWMVWSMENINVNE